jgi:hypothetical protein
LKRTTFLLMVERNLGMPGNLIRTVADMRDMRPLRVRPEDDYGAWTTRDTKMQYASEMRDQVRAGLLRFYKYFATIQDPTSPEERLDVLRPRVLEKLEDQMRRYRLIATAMEGKSALSEKSYTVHGCADEDGKINSRLKDDLVVALSIGIYWFLMTLYRKTPNCSFDFLDIDDREPVWDVGPI